MVAGDEPGGRTAVRSRLAEALPVDTTRVELQGPAEDFAWMPEAVELGWRREGRPSPAARARATPAATVMLADLDDGPAGTWGDRARIAIRALAVGYGLLAVSRGDRLEDVLGALAAPPVAAIDDELTRLGVVLALAPGRAGGTPRVAAAHYLRPVVRDGHGHVQRRAPAVLATWDPRTDAFEDFSWGISDELAGRLGLSAIELERAQARGRARLAGAVTRA